jgi:predicted esterase
VTRVRYGRGGLAALLVLTGALPTAGETAAPARGRVVPGVRCQGDSSQTYTLYLPRRYAANRTWPALLILDPRGRSVMAAELFREAAQEYGWILLSSNDTRSDGPMEPNIRALQALWPEVHERYATDPGRVYIAGFSGGAMLAWEVGRRTGQVAGVIGSGGRWLPEHFEDPIRFPCFGAAGDVDFNYDQMKALHSRLREWGTAERLEIFEGPHSWMPGGLAREAVEWMEVQAIRDGLRKGDEALLARLLARDLAVAAGLEEEGRLLGARRRYEAAARTFEGLISVARARREAVRLASLPAVRRALEEEERWDAWEEVTLRRHAEVYRQLLTAEPPLLLAAFRSAFGLDELRRRAGAESYEGVVARRLLQSLATQAGFYLPRELMRRGDHARAVVTLAIATEAVPDRPVLWYNLACSRARVGARTEALDALEEAVALGFSDRDHIASDEDLSSLRGEARFQALLGPDTARSAEP